LLSPSIKDGAWHLMDSSLKQLVNL